MKAIEHIRRMVRHHHEMVDGTGYPDRLKGESIPLGARIITVADCFDTMDYRAEPTSPDGLSMRRWKSCTVAAERSLIPTL